MTPDDILKAADHASGQSDRYLMIVLFIIFLLFAYFVFRGMARMIEQQRTAHEGAQNKLQDVLAGVVSQNTVVLARVSDVLKGVETLIAKNQ